VSPPRPVAAAAAHPPPAAASLPPASQVCDNGAIKYLDFSDVSGCFANNARNPRAAAVNGIAE
jgi:hypothetical protein